MRAVLLLTVLLGGTQALSILSAALQKLGSSADQHLQTRWRRSTAPIEPTITRNPAAAEVQEGTSVTFTCRSPSPDVTSYTFKKDVMDCDSRPCSIDSTHFEGESSSSYFSVNTVFPATAGFNFNGEYKYYCIARNSFGDSVRSVENTLIVREQPVVIGVVSDNTSPTQGMSTSLECKTDDNIGTVIKYYRWEKDGQVMIGESSQFVTATDSGEYSCQAFNSEHIKSDKSPAKRISVQDLPSAPTLTATDLTSEIVKEDALVNFQCSSGENVGVGDYKWYQMVAPMPHPTAQITSWLPIQGVTKYTYERSNTNTLQNFPGNDPVAYVYIACSITKDGVESPKSSYVRYIVRDETKTPTLRSVPAAHASSPGKVGVEFGTEVKLTCDGNMAAGTIRYDFFRDDKLIQSGRHEIFDITEEMSKGASGIYTCDATRNRLPSGESNSLEIEFVEKPSQPEIIETANILSHRTLSCEINPDDGITKYIWVKNQYNQNNQEYTSDVSIVNDMKSLNVPIANKALYKCQACKVVHYVDICSDYSFNYAFEVPEGPQPSMPTLTSDPLPLDDKPININEGTTVEMLCEVNPIDDPIFIGVIFYHDDAEISRIKKIDMTGPKNMKAKYEIKSAKSVHAGSYTCKTWSQQGVSDPSQPSLDFQVEEIVTGATLQRDPPQGPVVTGTVVTLTCNGKGQPESYSFFKEIEITPGFKELDLIQNGASNKLIWAPTPEESGLYSCQPISDKKDIVYDMSNEVNLDITEKPEPPLEVEAEVKLDFDPHPDIHNKLSDYYRNLKRDVTKALNDKAKSVSQFLSVEILDMKPGSLIVTFVAKADSAGGNPEASISRFFNAIGSGRDVSVMGQMRQSLGVTTQTPTPTIWSQPSSTYMRSGTTIKFFCQSQIVVPDQIYNFYRDNVLVASSSNGVLTIVATPAESGHYSCSVNFNRQPSIPSIPVERVFIDPSPKPIITANDENDVQSGTKLVLTCTVTPFPPQPALMSYEWFVMNGNLRKDIASKTQELTLDNVQPGSSGKYQCRAIIRGSVSSLPSAPYQVVVLDPPSKPTITGNPANPVLAGTNVQLTCSATARSGPISGYSWYLDGLQLAESSKFLIVRNVQSSGSSDKYTCRAFVGQPAGKVKSPLSADYQIRLPAAPQSPDAGGIGGSSSGGNGGGSGGQAKPNKPMLMRWPDKTDIPTGTTCYLICLAQTSPGATVTYSFYFNDKVVSTSASTAYVMEGSPAKSGYYTCQVHENSVSSDKSEAKIMVFADPNQAPVPPPAPSDVIPDAPSPSSTGTDTETETNTDTETETDNASVESDDTWELSLKTSKAWYSGTNANILIELYGSEGTSEIIDVGDVRKGRGDSDIVQFTTSNIGDLQYVGISHDGEKTKSNWKLEQFYVKNVDDASNMISGNPDTWILAEEQLVCDSDDCQIVKGSVDEWTDSWEINIQTSSGHRKSGTSSRVYVQLSGTEGNTAMVRLDQASGKFNKGGDDTFSIKTQAVGDLDTVTFTLDERGDNWKIWKFTVTNTGTGAVFEADPNDWLDNGQSLECSASGCNIISGKR